MKHTKTKTIKPNRRKGSGRKLCILLIVLFTLVMAADIANVLLTPAQSQMGFGSGGFPPEGGGFSMPEGDFVMPEGGMPGGFQMPEGAGEGMPEGDFAMPDGGTPDGFQMPEGAGEGMPDGSFQMPEGEMPTFEGGPGGNRGGRGSGLLQTLRRVWLPILVVCILGDGVCLFLLLRIRRRERAAAEAFAGTAGMPLLEEEEDPDEPPKRKRGPWTAILCLVVAFAMILAMIPTEDGDASSANVHQEVISGRAAAAQIQTVLSGAGTLEADTLTPVTVPQQVTVLKYHVRNGETVTAGDPLVSVDKISASSAMMDLQEVMEDLDDDLEVQRQASNATYLYSTAAGRVKKIYAAEGDVVTDVLYEHGALMLLSLDGTMKITFVSEENLTVGQAVTVRYSSITEEGRIASVREGTVTVTLSDETAWYGAEATVLDEAGKAIGEGTLEISSPLKVIGYYGNVKSISVDVGDKVSVGKTLMTLENTGYTTDYQILLARRNELEEQMQKLSRLAQTGMVRAENDGIVSGVPDDAEIELLSGSGAERADTLTGSGGWQLVLLSDVTVAEPEAEPDAVPEAEPIVEPADIAPIDNDPPPENPGGETPPSGGETPGGETPPSGGETPGGETPPSGGETPGGETPPSGGEIPGGETPPSGGEIPGGDQGQTVLSGTYAASLLTCSGGKLYVWLYPTAVSGDVELTGYQGQLTQFGEYSYSGIEDADILLTENGETKTVKLTDLKKDDLLLLSFTEGIVTGILKAQRSPAQSTPAGPGGQMPGAEGGGMPSGGGMGGGTMGGDTGSFAGGMPSSGSAAAVPESYDQYISEETELLYVSDQQEIAVTISVDELDILSLEAGLEAQVTLDAMKGRFFTGSIDRISKEGTNDGGNTKFTVTVILPREVAMLDGMNASVKIVTATSDAAVSIPSAALIEEDGRTFVYTAYDEEADTLSGLVEVETGASDGETVEILSGLEVGDTFYYRYADTVTYSFLTRA